MSVEIKNGLLIVAYIALCIFFYIKGVAIWILFALLAIWEIRKLFSDKTEAQLVTQEEESIVEGELDEWQVDGDLLYGLYINFTTGFVFVDLRHDELLKEREKVAKAIYSRKNQFEACLLEFMQQMNVSPGDAVAFIGLHSTQDPWSVELFLTSGRIASLSVCINEEDNGKRGQIYLTKKGTDLFGGSKN